MVIPSLTYDKSELIFEWKIDGDKKSHQPKKLGLGYPSPTKLLPNVSYYQSNVIGA